MRWDPHSVPLLHLKDQWIREIGERFGETFIVVDRAVVEATWGRNVWQEQPWVITSMDFAKQEEILAALAETRWGLVIVDEVHKLAAENGKRPGRRVQASSVRSWSTRSRRS